MSLRETASLFSKLQTRWSAGKLPTSSDEVTDLSAVDALLTTGTTALDIASESVPNVSAKELLSMNFDAEATQDTDQSLNILSENIEALKELNFRMVEMATTMTHLLNIASDRLSSSMGTKEDGTPYFRSGAEQQLWDLKETLRHAVAGKVAGLSLLSDLNRRSTKHRDNKLFDILYGDVEKRIAVKQRSITYMTELLYASNIPLEKYEQVVTTEYDRNLDVTCMMRVRAFPYVYMSVRDPRIASHLKRIVTNITEK